MIYIFLLIILYIVTIIVHAYIMYRMDGFDSRIHQVAYDIWCSKMRGQGYPRHENESYMTYWEAYDYFEKSNDKKIYTDHVRKNWKTIKISYANKIFKPSTAIYDTYRIQTDTISQERRRMVNNK